MKADHQPETVDFSVATLDDPEAVAPGFHIFWKGKIGWFEPRDELARHERSAPTLADSKPPIRQNRICQPACRVGTPRLVSSHCWIWLRGAAPTFWAIGWPPLNRSIVGIPRTP